MEPIIRIYVQYAGVNENDAPTKMFWTVILVPKEGEVTKNTIIDAIMKDKKLSHFARNYREKIEIYQFIPF